MGSLDELNDRWGNIGSSLKKFKDKHPDERVIYSSSGALFKRRGDTAFKRWTSPLNRRGNLIISDKRCFFSNPAISGETVIYLMAPMYFLIIGILAFIFFFFALIITRNVFLSVICDLICMSPLFLFMLVAIVLSIYQRFPYEIDLDLKKMKSSYLGRYPTLTRTCPLFSCFDGRHTYHLLGYRLLTPDQSEQIEKLFSKK
jgi:hypothetical protein